MSPYHNLIEKLNKILFLLFIGEKFTAGIIFRTINLFIYLYNFLKHANYVVCQRSHKPAKAITFFAHCTGDGEGMVHFGMAPSPPARQLVAPPAGGTPPSQRALCVCDVGSERRSFSSVYTSPLFVGTAEKKGIPWLFCSIAVWFRIRVPPALFCLLMCWATGKRALS